jgi:ABC-2 type transport system ATP-binding protein
MTSAPTQEPPQAAGEIAPPTPPIIQLRDVGKTFDEAEALRAVSLEVPEGEIFGLVGPSGCGKTTLVRLLVGLAVPTEGSVEVLGRPPADFRPSDRRQIGYGPQIFFLDPMLTVRENASFVAGLYGIGWFRRRGRVREVLEFLELWDARDRLASNVSGGMQRRLLLACALLHEPRLLVVDEPTAGLDPVLRMKIWSHLRELCSGGTSIVVTTQYLDEADYCDRLAVMSEGTIVAVGTPDELRAQAGRADTVELTVDDLESEDVAELWRLPIVRSVHTVAPGHIRLHVDGSGEASAAITAVLYERGKEVRTVQTSVPTFDEVFIELVGATPSAGPPT